MLQCHEKGLNDIPIISDTAELKEPEKVRASQEKALQALQAYTLGKFEVKKA